MGNSSGGAIGPEKTYLDALEAGVWKIQSCAECKQSVFYPRNVCPHCGCDELSWIKPSGNGTIYSSSTIYRSPELGGNYNVSLIDLEEGVRLMSTVQGCPPADVSIGMPVTARVDRSGSAARLVFDLAEVRA
jgi:uncharacterized OB-fold protein